MNYKPQGKGTRIRGRQKWYKSYGYMDAVKSGLSNLGKYADVAGDALGYAKDGVAYYQAASAVLNPPLLSG